MPKAEKKTVTVKSKKKMPSDEYFNRLSKPIKRTDPNKMKSSESFMPELCPKSLELTANREKFHERAEAELVRYKNELKRRENKKNNPPFSFKPTITPTPPDLLEKIKSKGDLYTRLRNDIQERKNKKQQNQKAMEGLFTFKPYITPSNVKVNGTFLERVAADVEKRKKAINIQEQGSNKANHPECTHKPVLSAKTQAIMGTKSNFLDRMTEDLENRVDKQNQIKADLAKPPKIKYGGKKKWRGSH
mmetsp:Transcript_1800/g.3240  ORF Transcript_1800/g.3240 Transcript_1800/m.3240 type:complete len:246 (-) Transcript_1800:54-791(-)